MSAWRGIGSRRQRRGGDGYVGKVLERAFLGRGGNGKSLGCL